MFNHSKTWRQFKKELIEKYKNQIDVTQLKQMNKCLLITAVFQANDALFEDIIASPYCQQAMNEVDAHEHNALFYAMFRNNDYYEQLIEKGAVLSVFPQERDEIIVSKYQEFLKHRQNGHARGYARYLTRLKNQIKQMTNINHEIMNGHSLLTLAIVGKDRQMVDYLLDLNASPLSGRIDSGAYDLNAFELVVCHKWNTFEKRLYEAIPADERREAMVKANEKCDYVQSRKIPGKVSHLIWNGMGLIILGVIVSSGLQDCSNKSSKQNPKPKPIPVQTQNQLPMSHQKVNEKQ